MTQIEKQNLLVMKLIHYFITEKNYNPVVVHGAQNEIWLENMNSEYKIVRIVTSYIHNKEQLDFDNYKVSKMAKQIKLKTFSFKMKVMSFYLDLNSDLDLTSTKLNEVISIKSENKISKNDNLMRVFPDMKEKMVFKEKGNLLYERINDDIMKKNIKESKKINDLFTPKKTIITYILIGICTILMLLMYILGKGSEDIKTLYFFGALVKDKNILRVIISMFLHIGIIHFIMNMWALKILGTQVENFYGHIKTLIIFLYSGIVGNLLSLILMPETTISAGASGAIFGLMGAILYFALNQRTYMADALRKEILPVIIINLLSGFIISGINMYAHVGGLIGGMLISIALGIKYKTSKTEKINGIICSIVLVLLLTYLAYFR